MPYGSRVDFAEPRDEKAMLRRMRASGLLPLPGPSHDIMLYKQFERMRKGMEVNNVRERRLEQDGRVNHQLEMDRMADALRRNRVAGLRGAAAERLNANNVAAQVVA